MSLQAIELSIRSVPLAAISSIVTFGIGWTTATLVFTHSQELYYGRFWKHPNQYKSNDDAGQFITKYYRNLTESFARYTIPSSLILTILSGSIQAIKLGWTVPSTMVVTGASASFTLAFIMGKRAMEVVYGTPEQKLPGMKYLSDTHEFRLVCAIICIVSQIAVMTNFPPDA